MTKLRSLSWSLLAAALLAGLPALQPVASRAQSPAAPESAAPTPERPKPTPIALTDVTDQAEVTSAELRSIAKSLERSEAVERIEERLELTVEEIDADEEQTAATLTSEPTIGELQDEETQWLAIREPFGAWNNTLKGRAKALNETLARLDELSEVWQLTREEARQESAPPALIERIDAVRGEVRKVRKNCERRRDEVLTLQSRVAKQDARISLALDQLDQARGDRVASVFERTGPAMWSQSFRERLMEDPARRLGDAVDRQWKQVTTYSQANAPRMTFFGIVFVVLAASLRFVRGRMRARAEREPRLGEAAEPFQVPVAAALVVTILLARWSFEAPPRPFITVLSIFALFPTVLVLRHLVPKAMLPLLQGLLVFFFLDIGREFTEGTHLSLARLVFLLEMLGAVGLLLWVIRPSRVAQIPPELLHGPILRVVGYAINVGLVGFGTAALAQIVGFDLLALILGDGLLVGAYIAAIFYAALRVVSSLVTFSLHIWPFTKLGMVRLHGRLIERRIHRFLGWVATLSWAFLTLRALQIDEPVLGAIGATIGAELTLGSLSVSLSDVLAFGVALWLSFLIARFVGFVLNEEVFPRAHMARGVPYAITNLLRYTILFVGFLAAVAAAGIPLDQFAFLAGALGVGIGFGLQNVVNNFVSGIILLFERPIQVGDAVQLGTLWGEVRRIGIRASVVRTWDGSEVVVPNGQLISEQVVNWTLSDKQRRLEVEVGVEYGTDPERVLALLRQVAEEHPDVLDDPKPLVLFQGFGDSSLNFSLRAWTPDFDRGLSIRSQLAVAVNAALAREGIRIPFPQRDLHLRSAEPEMHETLSGRSRAQASPASPANEPRRPDPEPAGPGHDAADA